MEGRAIYGFIATILIILLLSIYWFLPHGSTKFGVPSNYNFSTEAEVNSTLQFYPNMRFSETSISYNIDENCPLKQKNDMEWAFDIMEEKTILSFYPVGSGEQITITCDEKTRHEGRLFIAGEGGPTNITSAGDYNVIEAGSILLIRDSDCESPNVATHELLHVLGFDHSQNPNNIMYEISRCDQTIGEDVLDFIDNIYSIPPLPDLVFEEAKASVQGRYLDINFSIRNNGIADAGESVVKIFADDKEVKSIDIPNIDIGYGRSVYMTNIWVKQTSVQNIRFSIENSFEELDETNNEITFGIKE